MSQQKNLMARDFQITLQDQCGSGLQSLLKLRDLSNMIIIIIRHFVLGNSGRLITAAGTILRSLGSKSPFK